MCLILLLRLVSSGSNVLLYHVRVIVSRCGDLRRCNAVFGSQIERCLTFQSATGTAEVGGWSTRELLTILDGLEGLDVVGADVGMYLRSAQFSHMRWHTADIEM